MSLKRALVRGFQRYVLNPPARAVVSLGVLRDYVLLETTGRRSGKVRRVPVGARRFGDEVWMVSEHGRHSGYVRNIEANPRVRMKMGGQWHEGVAHLVDDDDPRARLATLWGRRGNAPGVRLFGTDLLTIRIDLDR
jgi:deazaflavin-dependent oxidoreductase (nitroreductase family)